MDAVQYYIIPTGSYTEDLTTMMAIIGPTKAKIIPLSLGNQQLQKGYVDFRATRVRLVNVM